MCPKAKKWTRKDKALKSLDSRKSSPHWGHTRRQDCPVLPVCLYLDPTAWLVHTDAWQMWRCFVQEQGRRCDGDSAISDCIFTALLIYSCPCDRSLPEEPPPPVSVVVSLYVLSGLFTSVYFGTQSTQNKAVLKTIIPRALTLLGTG